MWLRLTSQPGFNISRSIFESGLMADTLHKGATSVHLFIIRNKKVDKVRMLYWEDDGFWFLYN
ncbi:IS66 family insertion sequence element accessory protein TnpB [Microbulbifer variabilis]|jgi:hypothetical protein|uniref:IS66 family insertion sequence element accessory protein TnpB n=1 Tax=Microbulbifer variabilis TaxID=266805 RepID=UPI0033657D3F